MKKTYPRNAAPFSVLLLLLFFAAVSLPAFADTVIVGGKRAGGVELGQAFSKYEKRLGKKRAIGTTMFDFPGSKMALMVKNGVVEGIIVYSPGYRTAEGIRVGDPVKKLKDKYGNYLTTETGALVYTELGLAFNEKDYKITRIMVVPATPDPLLGDKMVVPGKRAGNIIIGMDYSSIEKQWGRPDSSEKMQGNEKFTVHKYEKKGIKIISESGMVAGAEILSYKFRTPEGIGVKSTRDQVVKTYGKRFKEVKDSIDYKSLGIGFYFNKGEVIEILLSPKSE
ncbi:MAG: hypothetical protein LWY06_09635 [Firmicutes bacterium]|nr:hypothetical protein [Bacillota bacterium]